MATGTSLILIAVGAVLAIAIDYQVSGIDIKAIGGILLVVGIIGLLYSLFVLASFGPLYQDRGHHDHI